MGLLNSVSFQRLQGGLDAATKRQSVLANNVANNDTPNFKRSDVSFESFLRDQESGLKATLGCEGIRLPPFPLRDSDRHAGCCGHYR